MVSTQRVALTSARIYDAALRIIDDVGLPCLSMRRLGLELGVEAMSLYHHVPSKTALLSGVVEQLLSRVETGDPSGDDWQDQLRRMAWEYRRLAHAHPNAFPLIVMREHQTPQIVRLLDATVAICRATGAPDDACRNAFYAVAGFVSGFALIEIGGFFELAGEHAAGDPLLPNGVCEPDDAATLAARDARFAFGLDAVLTGLAAELAAAAAPNTAAPRWRPDRPTNGVARNGGSRPIGGMDAGAEERMLQGVGAARP